MRCTVCGTKINRPIYESNSDQALTSLCELRPGRVRVWSCPSCAHLCNEALPDTDTYYESEYRILLDEDDEDQIYEVLDEQIVYRTDHQVTTLLNKLDLPQGSRLLDYGCAKASTPKRLLTSRNDLQVSLFDVSTMYVNYWNHFVEPQQYAVYQTPPLWQGYFDIVTSFFALEHIPEPLGAVQRIASLLKDDGVFYGIVPDTFSNVADFVVIDHVNHFTTTSLHTLLRAAGFKDIQIDATAHRGALVFTARKTGVVSACSNVTAIRNHSEQLARYWSQLDKYIQNSEKAHAHKPAAIYGSGFYGAYIFTALRSPEQVMCFLDASKYQQGKQLFSKSIIAPNQLPKSIRTLYVGLNPNIARDVIAKIDWLQTRELRVIYLDKDTQ